MRALYEGKMRNKPLQEGESLKVSAILSIEDVYDSGEINSDDDESDDDFDLNFE